MRSDFSLNNLKFLRSKWRLYCPEVFVPINEGKAMNEVKRLALLCWQLTKTENVVSLA